MKGVLAETAKNAAGLKYLGTWLQMEVQGNQLKDQKIPFHVEVVAQRCCRAPMDLGDPQCVTECPEHPVLGDPAVSRGLGCMFSRVSFQPQLFWEQQVPLNLTRKIKNYHSSVQEASYKIFI